MAFATWIRETRVGKGLQVSECAHRAGVGQPTWSEYEAAPPQKEWRKATACKIADGLGVHRDIALLEAGILPREDPDIHVARRLGPIIGRVDASKRGQIVDALAEMAERMVSFLGDSRVPNSEPENIHIITDYIEVCNRPQGASKQSLQPIAAPIVSRYTQ